MDTAKIQTLKNHTTGEAVAPRTVLEAVTGLTEALADKAEKSALDEKANVADLAGKADITYVDNAIQTAILDSWEASY